MISTVIVSREPFPDLKTVRSLLTTHEMRLKSRVQNPLVDATSASPMVLLAKSNTSARRGPSLEKVNNPCWSFAKGSCRFCDACKYLHNGVHGKSTLLPCTSGSASSVSGVTRSDLDMLQSLLAKFGLNSPNISTPSPPVAYTLLPGSFGVSNMGMAGLFPQGVQYSKGVTTAGGPLSTAGGSNAFWSTAGGSPCTWNFIAASSVYDMGSTAARGFFPCIRGINDLDIQEVKCYVVLCLVILFLVIKRNFPLEIELWNLKVKGNNVPAYTKRFQELTLIYTKFVANETEKVDKYISGLPNNIYGNVKSARSKTLDETIELANDLMDQKLCNYTERQSDNKRKAVDASRNNHGLQYGDRRKEAVWGILAQVHQVPFSPQWPVHPEVLQVQQAPKGNGCFECGALGHFKRDCPKLKNKDGGNGNAQGWVYAVGNAEKRGNASGNPDSNVVTGTFLLNNHYASILFDTGADRSFISTAFSSLIDIVPTPLDNSYDVELADGKIVGIDTIIRGCTLNFLDHPFNIDLMPVELGSFDVIIGMDWLRRCHAVIVCDEKLVQVPYGNETLTFCGNESSNERESRLAVISYSKAQEYMAKGCQVFLAQISAKKEEDKSEGKQIKDVPIVRDFPEVFPEDLPGLPPARPVEFQIDLIPGAA
ncbi:putative reverse transcriptase domain-containing protein, partial [Tanacetum coccineum]